MASAAGGRGAGSGADSGVEETKSPPAAVRGPSGDGAADSPTSRPPSSPTDPSEAASDTGDGKASVGSHKSSRSLPRAPSGHSDGSTRLCLEGKLVVLGESHVGKTSIVSHFTKGEFDPKALTTVGVAFTRKTVKLDNVTCNFNIWDTAGQEKFRSINSLYYRKAAAAIIVYDITNRASFDTLNYWLTTIRQYGAKDCIVAIAGNKNDKASDRQVPIEEARAFAADNGVLCVETSAKTGANIRQLFEEIVVQAPRHVQAGIEDGFRVVKVERGKTIELAGESQGGGRRSCCGGSKG